MKLQTTAKGDSELSAILGWVLFALTIAVAVWRDVHQQGEAEKRSAEDARYLLDKQKEWLAEKGNSEVRNDNLVRMLVNVRKAIDQ